VSNFMRTIGERVPRHLHTLSWGYIRGHLAPGSTLVNP
jgi:hypothetical protein